MAKQFIKVSSRYTTKNKLQELISNELYKLDRVLCNDGLEANKVIETAYKTALEQYKGHAKQLPLKDFVFNKTMTQYSVEDVIVLNVYTVKQEV